MNAVKYFLVVLVYVGMYLNLFGQSQTPEDCFAYTVDRNEVTFHCLDSAKIKLKLASSSVIKIWYAPDGKFQRSNESFAVINEELEEISNIQVSESASAYEIFTGPLRIRVNRKPFQLQIFDKWQKLLFGGYQDQGFQYSGTEVKAVNLLRDDEHFFGLGEKSGSLDRRGQSYKMWNSDKPCYGINEDPLYKSIPFFMSSYNYGIFFDNTYLTEFDFGASSNDYYSFSAPNGEMIFYFIFGKDYKEIINGYTQLTGKPIMPPKWALGFSQSRGMLTNEALSREIAAGYRERQIPCDIIYQDIGWVEGLQNFEWWKERYQNPKQMLSDLADDGFKVVVSQDPVISQSTIQQWKEADSLGYFTTDVRTHKTYDMPWPWGGNCGVVDFTNPEVADWWGQYQQKPLDDGVKGFWTDMGEPAWSNEESTDRLYMKHHLGMHDEIHNVYGLTWDKVVTEQFEKRNPNQRVFQMTRAAYAGLQRYTFGWSGDAGNGSNVLEGWQQFENQIPVALSAGMGLIPFWATDISGYCGDIEDYDAMAELYVRWLQFGVFNPISRAHHEGNNAVEPWLFGDKAEKASKKAIELKYQLFPYLYTYAREAYDTGLPIMRAMILEYPNDPEALKAEHQFMFGQELLVAPVTKQRAKIKQVYLPAGEWINFFTGESYEGGQWIGYPVTLDDIPVFVKSGSIIPMMPVMQYIHQVQDYPITFRVYGPDDPSSFTLYEDDGVTNDYKKNIFSSTLVTNTLGNEGQKIVTVERKHEAREATPRSIIIELTIKSSPKRVSLDGQKLKLTNSKKIVESEVDQEFWSYDKNSGKLHIKFSDSDGKRKIEIQ